MTLEEITKPVRKQVKTMLVIRVLDQGKHELLEAVAYSNRKKVYDLFCSMGTVYAIRKGNEFKRPLLTYKTFCEYMKGDPEQFKRLYIASTGVFAGRYLVKLIQIK